MTQFSKLKNLLFCVVFISGFLIWGNAQAACSWDGNTGTVAAPYDDSDVQGCINDAYSKSGILTILIPNSNVIHNAVVSVNQTGASYSSLTITGESEAGTIITNSTWEIVTAADKKFRITSLTLKGSTIGSNRDHMINIAGNTKPPTGGFRIDHITWDSDDNPGGETTARAITVTGWAYGVVDHQTAGWYGQFMLVYTGSANAAWAADDSFGTYNAVYLENSTLINKRANQQSMLMDNWDGSRVVARFNTADGYYIGGHDVDSYVRATRHWEYYNNIMNTDFSYGSPLFSIRGGTGYVYNNTLVTSQTNPFFSPSGIMLRNYRSYVQHSDSWCDNTPEYMCVVGSQKRCTSDADCGGTVNSCQQEDGNEDETGYPCRDQIGRAKDQSLLPAIFWNNRLIKQGVTSVANAEVFGDNSGWTFTNPSGDTSGTWVATYHIASGRDYCNADTNMPMSCGGIDINYSAYTCPHPLTELTGSCDFDVAGTAGYNISGGDIVAPAAPSGLAVT